MNIPPPPVVNIPKPPAVAKAGFRFPNVRLHQRKQELKDEILQVIKDLRRSTVVPAYQEMLTRFICVICPGTVLDFSRLPIQTGGPNDKIAGTAIGCLYAKIAWLLQKFWEFYLGQTESDEHVVIHLNDLKAIAACGFDKCKVIGNIRDGKHLEVPE